MALPIDGILSKKVIDSRTDDVITIKYQEPDNETRRKVNKNATKLVRNKVVDETYNTYLKYGMDIIIDAEGAELGFGDSKIVINKGMNIGDFNEKTKQSFGTWKEAFGHYYSKIIWSFGAWVFTSEDMSDTIDGPENAVKN